MGISSVGVSVGNKIKKKRFHSNNKALDFKALK